MRLPLASILFIAGCGGAAATATGPRDPAAASNSCHGEPAALRFAWPEELRAHVEGRDLTESAFADGSSPMRGDSPSDLRMIATADGAARVVRFEIARQGRFRTTGFAPEVAGERPGVVLSPEGEVLAIEGIDRMQQALVRAVQEGRVRADEAQSVAPNVTLEVQLATARAHWDWIVRAWHGRTMRCGELVRATASVPSLSFGSIGAIQLEVELELVGESACGPATSAPGARCVALRARQRAIHDDLLRGLAPFAAQAGGGASIADARLERTIDLVAEVDTLVPHRVTIEERSQLTWRAPGEADRVRHIRDVQAYSFDYSAEASRAETHVMVDPESGRFAVMRDGRPVQLPDTPACRAFVACCGALGPTGGMMCGMLIASFEGEDCTEELEMARVQARGREGGVPAECAGP